MIDLIFTVLVTALVMVDCSALLDEGSKRRECAGVNCHAPPVGATCKKDTKAKGRPGIPGCCPDLECTLKNGSVIKHYGFTGSGSSGSSYSFSDPSTGTKGQGFNKSFATHTSFSSSSSSSSGGNLEDIKKFQAEMQKNMMG